ncbi:calcium-independent phospholipase A2-gamma-like [Branchiostoma lanceolatum]|uniref:calcium-independent phospholipase A2-gamma-like n=1 Tax=Branchiostoma lanceolatum TaxID=7740 RepID=UPI003452FB9D
MDGKGIREMAESQARVLHEFFGSDVCNKTSVCCVCLGRNVDVFLPCGHAICSADHKLKVLSGDKVFLCPFPHNAGLVSSMTTQSINDYQNDDPVAIPEAENVGIRLLALDGGGVLGLVQIAVLLNIHRLVSDFAPGIEIHELFDLIIGTSIGSLIGATIGLLHKNPTSVKEFYLRSIKNVFQKVGWKRFSGDVLAMLSGSRYSNAFLASQLRDMYADRTLNGDEIPEDHKDQRQSTTSATQSSDSGGQKSASGNERPSADSGASKTGRFELKLPIVACVVYDVDQQNVVTFSGHNCTHRARDVVLASMAAPPYFPPVKIFNNGRQQTYCDGGVGANCPAAEGRKLAREVWPEKPVDLMLSLACRGRPPGTTSSFTASLVHFISRTEQIWDEMEKDNDCFVRVSPKTETRIHDWALDNTDVDTLQGIIDKWIEKPATQRQLRHVACMLSAKFFYLGSFTPEVARWRPGQTCRVGIFQRKTRYTLQETDFRVVVKIGNSEVLCSVQPDPNKDGGFFVEFVCPRRDVTLSVQLCILGSEVDVSGSPFVFSVK